MSKKQNLISRAFQEGLFLILPIGVTIGLIYWAWSFLRDFVPENITNSLRVNAFNNIPYSTTMADLLFFVIVILVILVSGMIASTMLGRFVNFIFEKIMLSPTMIRPIYQTFKKISEIAFKQNTEGDFSQNLSRSVIVPYPNKNLTSIGFITNDSASMLLGEEEGKNWVTLYIPSAPIITAGFFVLCKKEDLEKCQLNGAQALSSIISVGTIAPDTNNTTLELAPPKKSSPFRVWFLNGLLVLTPLVGTLSILNWLFKYLYKALLSISSTLPLIKWIPENIYDITVNSILLVIILLLIMFIGLIGESAIGTWMRNSLNRMLNSLPMINSIYDIASKITKMFSPDPSKDNKFNQAVLVPYPTESTYVVGFVTGENSYNIKAHGSDIPIFIPTTPIPTTGWFVLAKPETIIPLNMTIEKAFGLVISAGILSENDKTHDSKFHSKS